jgi:hypothetical protein
MEVVSRCAALRVDKEITEAALIRAGGADQIIQIASKRHTVARRRVDMYAVTLKVPVVAEVTVYWSSQCVSYVELM